MQLSFVDITSFWSPPLWLVVMNPDGAETKIGVPIRFLWGVGYLVVKNLSGEKVYILETALTTSIACVSYPRWIYLII